jgi:Holliday junction resolvase RusA-like endonuclease
VKRGGLRMDEQQFREAAGRRGRFKPIVDSAGKQLGEIAIVAGDVPTLTDVVMPLTLVLPWPPTGNHAVKHNRLGQHYRTGEYNDYRSQVAFIAKQRRARQCVGKLDVSVLFWPPDNGRYAGDLDNLWKVAGDSLQHAGIFRNDAAIDRLELVRMHRRERGEVVVTVKAA